MPLFKFCDTNIMSAARMFSETGNTGISGIFAKR